MSSTISGNEGEERLPNNLGQNKEIKVKIEKGQYRVKGWSHARSFEGYPANFKILRRDGSPKRWDLYQEVGGGSLYWMGAFNLMKDAISYVSPNHLNEKQKKELKYFK